MERLKILLLVATMLSTGQLSEAQQSPTEAPVGSAVGNIPNYTVIGDVRDPRTTEIPGDRLTIRSAVLFAQPFASPVSVSVLRRTQERVVWTQLISTDTADTGEFVVPGDVLIVQAINGLQTPVQQNAAVRTDAGVQVVLLSDESVAIGDVLQQTVGLPTRDQEVSISSRFQGRPNAAKVSLASIVAHGDVIDLGQSSQKVLKGFGALAPAFSEWRPEGNTVNLAPPALTTVAAEVTTDAVPPSAPLEFPTEFDERPEPAEPAAESPAANDSTEPVEDFNDIIDNTVKPASQSSVTDSTMLEDAAPNPPEPKMTVTAEETSPSGLNFWNVVVIGGLIVAGILLLAGSLSEEDDAEVLQQSTPRQSTRNHSTEQEERKTKSFLPSIESHRAFSSASIESQASVLKSPQTEKIAEIHPLSSEKITRCAGMNSESLVKPTEWFSGEWRRQPEGTSFAEAVLDQGKTIQPKATGHAVEVPQSVPDESNSIVRPKISDAEAERLENLVRSIAAEGRKHVNAAPEPPARSTEFADLEDLLQNRLPIDLLQAQLPLRISLFGRPAGPRRMRIDAAHSALSGPHTHLNSSRRQDVGMPDLAPKSESGRLDALIQDEGLDRALSSLQDRTNS